MTTAPMVELIIEFTNAIRNSKQFHTVMTGSDEANHRFDKWQDVLVRTAVLVSDSWNNNDDTCERAIDTFRSTCEIYFRPNNNNH